MICACAGVVKEYKNCHLKKKNNSKNNSKERQLPAANTFRELIQNYNSFQILKIIGVLQLQPANHKKYLRLEQMARLTLLELRNSQDHKLYAYWDLLKNAIFSFTECNHLEEDPPSLFTENVVFLHGNYTVYPGFNVTATKILNELFESIFLVENKMNEDFKTVVKDAAGLLLLLSDETAAFAQHKRFMYEPGTTDKLVFPEYDDVFKYLDAITFSEGYLQKNAEFYVFDRSVLKAFTIDVNDEGLSNDDPDENTAVFFPLIEIEGETIVYLISGILPALTDFIYTKAAEFGELDELNRIFTERQFEKTVSSLKQTGWRRVNAELPVLKQEINIQEAVFRFDTQKIAYLCFINPKPVKQTGKTSAPFFNPFDERNKEVVAALSKIATEHPVEILTLYVLSETGSDFYFAWPKSPEGHLSLPVSYNELDALTAAENTNALTLWQFAKTYTKTLSSYKVKSPGGTLDAYLAYKNNKGSFLDTDKKTEKGAVIYIPVGYSNDFLRDALRRQDEHAVTLLYKRQRAYTKVIRYKQYAPIYKQKENIIEQKGFFKLVVETFKMPVWITAEVEDNEWAKFSCEGVAFWLNRMAAELSSVFDKLTFLQFEFKFIIDKSLRQTIEFKTAYPKNFSVDFKIVINAPVIEITVPFEFLYLVQRKDNAADKTIMKAVLDGFVLYVAEASKKTLLSSEEIAGIIDRVLVPETAKMFLFTETANNLKHDDSDLPPLLRINDAAVADILENIVEMLPSDTQIPETIQKEKEKRQLCNNIVAALNNKIAEKLQQYDGIMLLEMLIKINEKVIHVRERKEILIPAKITSFSTFEKEVEEFMEGENLTELNQVLRVLIEYVAVKIPAGTKWPNGDETEELLAMVDQVLSWGNLSESIWKKLQNPKMGLLPSGRIGVEKEIQDNFLGPLFKAQVTSEIFRYTEAGRKADKDDKTGSSINNKKLTDLDIAFQAEFGLKMSDLTAIIYILSHTGAQRKSSCLQLEETELIILVTNNAPDLSAEIVKTALSLMSLLQRDHINAKVPDLNIEQIYPWRHKRTISYLRRPLVRYTKDDKTFYLFGFRHLLVFLENFYYLLYESKLPNAVSPEMTSWLGKISGAKGTPFRTEVYRWFINNSSFEVMADEIDIKEKGPLFADRDYGDIDILAFDHSRKIIYSIECKNITGAKTIYEMWSEIETYLGDGGSDDAKIIKHLNRHTWLTTHQEQLQKFSRHDISGYTITSFVLSVDEIPLAYLTTVTLPLPIKSFAFLRKDGPGYLDDL